MNLTFMGIPLNTNNGITQFAWMVTVCNICILHELPNNKLLQHIQTVFNTRNQFLFTKLHNLRK